MSCNDEVFHLFVLYIKTLCQRSCTSDICTSEGVKGGPNYARRAVKRRKFTACCPFANPHYARTLIDAVKSRRRRRSEASKSSVKSRKSRPMGERRGKVAHASERALPPIGGKVEPGRYAGREDGV